MKKKFVLKFLKLLIFIFVSILFYLLPLPIAHEAKIVLGILVFGMLLWVTEFIPLFLTSLIIALLLVIFRVFSFDIAVSKFFDPILVLLLGGFLLARAMQKHDLDHKIAWTILKKVKTSKMLLLWVMIITAFLSFWISNTASTFIMIPIALAIVLRLGKKLTNFTKAMVLGVAYSANIGGAGTLIGTPPNLIAVSNLAETTGINISFLQWMGYALPLVVVMIPIAWFILLKIFPLEVNKIKKIRIKIDPLNKKQKLFIWIFLITVGFWLTTSLTGLSSGLIAICAGAVLFAVGLLKPNDLNKVSWTILFLLGGGLVLGAAMFKTGLAAYFAELLGGALTGLPSFLILFLVVVFAILMTMFAANTGTAAIVIPVIIPLATILGLPIHVLAILTGIAVSFDFIVPIGTPPNAIAYESGKLKMLEMMKAGFFVSLSAAIVLTIFAYFFWL